MRQQMPDSQHSHITSPLKKGVVLFPGEPSQKTWLRSRKISFYRLFFSCQSVPEAENAWTNICGPCFFYWSVLFLLVRAFFIGPCFFYWSVLLYMVRAFTYGLCFYIWSVHIFYFIGLCSSSVIYLLARAFFTGPCIIYWFVRSSCVLLE